jgi:histidinol-phosphatase (PHP family)
MGLFDQHVHSRHSVDCQADPVGNVNRAIELGLAGITFNEHYDSHPDEREICIYDYEKIGRTLESLRAGYGEHLFIGRGIEVCYQPAMIDEILRHVETHAFDMVMLSVHFFDGRAMHEPDQWAGVDPAFATRSYLEGVLEATRLVLELKRQGRRPFDVLGHLDLVKRYTQRYFGVYDVLACRELVDEILRTCLEADLAVELNTSTLRQAVPELMPADWAVRRYAELGGEAMLLGSDAHKSEHIGAGFDAAIETLERAGIRRQAVFQRRERSILPLQ